MEINEEIKAKIDIVDLVGRYVNLKKSGSNYKANCPFHNENTPSFMVSPSLQIFKCFGCGKAGDIFTFLMEMEGVDYKQALIRLGEEAQVDVSKLVNKKGKDYSKYYEINEVAQKFYAYTLLNLKVGQEALKYLKNRGLTKTHIEQFGLGYAPNSWDNITKYMQKKGFTSKDLVTAGLIKVGRGNSHYDVYRGRIIFPLISEMNKIVGFSGRTIINEDPKYINTKDTPIFKKSNFIYNLNNAKVHIKQQKQAIVVEGEFDCITPFIKGIKNVVALKGTSFTAQQATLIKRYCEEAVIFFDSDSAGLEAAARGIEIATNAGLNVKIASLPKKYKDPDEAASESIDSVIKAVDNAIPAYDYFFNFISQKYDKFSAFGKTKIAQFLKPKIAKIEDRVIKAHYTKKLAELLDISEQNISIDQIKTSNANVKDKQSNEVNEGFSTLLLYLMRSKPSVLKHFYKLVTSEKLLLKNEQQIITDYYQNFAKKGKDINEFVKSKNSDKYNYLILKPLEDFDDLDTNAQKSIIKGIASKKQVNNLKLKIKKISYKMKQAESLGKAKKLDKLQKKINILARQLSKLN